MEQILQIERELNEIRSKQAAAEEQHRTIFRRLDQQDKLLETVHTLATSVSVMSNEQGQLKRAVDGLCMDVEEIKSKPAKRWEGVVEKILFAIVGAMVTFILAKIGIV